MRCSFIVNYSYLFTAYTKTVITDSLGRGVQQFLPASIKLQYIPGLKLATVLKKYCRDQLDFQYDIIFILLGSNDSVNSGKGHIYELWRSVISGVRFLAPKGVKILVSTFLPRLDLGNSLYATPVELNCTQGFWSFLVKACNYTKATPVDLRLHFIEGKFPALELFVHDGIHLSTAGRRRLANVLNMHLHRFQTQLP